ncbi:hypothetical protein [Microbispora sp. NPDC049633]|uniref:hypothetical protein n=1 Tax=Microbispora sp. NPDC049633 TaxID=3154355 RepID=UPI00343DB912
MQCPEEGAGLHLHEDLRIIKVVNVFVLGLVDLRWVNVLGKVSSKLALFRLALGVVGNAVYLPPQFASPAVSSAGSVGAEAFES